MNAPAVYLDAATAAPLHPVARQALLAALDDGWADPSKLYSRSRRARQLLDAARAATAETLGVRADEVIFTANGTTAVLHVAPLPIVRRVEAVLGQGGPQLVGLERAVDEVAPGAEAQRLAHGARHVSERVAAHVAVLRRVGGRADAVHARLQDDLRMFAARKYKLHDVPLEAGPRRQHPADCNRGRVRVHEATHTRAAGAADLREAPHAPRLAP